MKYFIPLDDKRTLVVNNDALPFPIEKYTGGWAASTQFHLWIGDEKGNFDSSNHLNSVGNFYMGTLFGCCGIAVVAHTCNNGRVSQDKVREIQENMARITGYSCIISSAKIGGSTEKELDKSYEVVERFQNRRSYNNVIIGIKKI